MPSSPGIWDGFFTAARLAAIAGLVVAIRSLAAFRLALLDGSVIVAAGIALGAPFVWYGLEQGATAATLFTLNRPILSVIVLMLVVSAALASPQGMPLSLALLGLGEVPLMIGNLIYSYTAVQGTYADDRWANLAWSAGALISTLAACVLILGVDRRVRPRLRTKIPNCPPGFHAVVLLCAGALALTLAVACYGLLSGERGVAAVGLIASVVIGVATGLRASDAIRKVAEAYLRLDRALAEKERVQDELLRANVEIRATQIAFAEVLNLADERSHGRMRALIEDTGSELAALLEEAMERRRPKDQS